jgi:hypothetical protein
MPAKQGIDAEITASGTNAYSEWVAAKLVVARRIYTSMLTINHSQVLAYRTVRMAASRLRL